MNTLSSVETLPGFATVDGKTVAESVPGKPFWLEYSFKPEVIAQEGFPIQWSKPVNPRSALENPENPWENKEGY